MKKLYKYIITLALAASLAPSCTSNFDEINKDPNRYVFGSISPYALIENIIYTGTWGYQYRGWRFAGELMQYTVETGSTTEFKYFYFAATEYQNAWTHHARWASNADHMAELARAQGDSNAEAIALTMKAMYISCLTDLFGDIPYTDAFKSRTEGNVTPAFDSQKSVYEAMLTDLEKANTLYDLSKTMTYPNKDLLFGGNFAKWQKFTNSLRLRLLMRLSNRASEMNVASKINEIINNPATNPIISSNSENAVLAYTGVTPFNNPYGDYKDSEFNVRKAGSQIIDMMNAAFDPRLPVYFTLGSGSNGYVGMKSGDAAASTTGCATVNLATFKQYNSPYNILTYSEVQFILAEAAQRGFIAGGNAVAASYYENAVKASVKQWAPTVTDAVLNTFYNDSDVIYNSTIERIINQKYISLFMSSGYESYNDYRRTGYPALQIGPNVRNDKVFPTRLCYPETIIATNNENYKLQLAKMATDFTGGADDMKTPVWWAAR